jgi:hypothetical protein
MSCVNLRLFYRVCEIEPGLLAGEYSNRDPEV